VLRYSPLLRGPQSFFFVQGNVTMYGFAQKSSMRKQIDVLPKGTKKIIWPMDGLSGFEAACREGFDFVITNRPTGLDDSRSWVLEKCQEATKLVPER
jgi:hypothetical protein